MGERIHLTVKYSTQAEPIFLGTVRCCHLKHRDMHAGTPLSGFVEKNCLNCIVEHYVVMLNEINVT